MAEGIDSEAASSSSLFVLLSLSQVSKFLLKSVLIICRVLLVLMVSYLNFHSF